MRRWERVEAPALAGPAQLSLPSLQSCRATVQLAPIVTEIVPSTRQHYFHNFYFTGQFLYSHPEPSFAFFAHRVQSVQVHPPQLAPIVTKIVPPPPPSTRNIRFHSFKLKPVKFYAHFTAVIISASTLKLVFLQETILCSFTPPKKTYLLSFLNGNCFTLSAFLPFNE